MEKKTDSIGIEICWSSELKMINSRINQLKFETFERRNNNIIIIFTGLELIYIYN